MVMRRIADIEDLTLERRNWGFCTKEAVDPNTIWRKSEVSPEILWQWSDGRRSSGYSTFHALCWVGIYVKEWWVQVQLWSSKVAFRPFGYFVYSSRWSAKLNWSKHEIQIISLQFLFRKSRDVNSWPACFGLDGVTNQFNRSCLLLKPVERFGSHLKSQPNQPLTKPLANGSSKKRLSLRFFLVHYFRKLSLWRLSQKIFTRFSNKA